MVLSPRCPTLWLSPRWRPSKNTKEKSYEKNYFDWSNINKPLQTGKQNWNCFDTFWIYFSVLFWFEILRKLTVVYKTTSKNFGQKVVGPTGLKNSKFITVRIGKICYFLKPLYHHFHPRGVSKKLHSPVFWMDEIKGAYKQHFLTHNFGSVADRAPNDFSPKIAYIRVIFKVAKYSVLGPFLTLFRLFLFENWALLIGIPSLYSSLLAPSIILSSVGPYI